MDKSFRGAAAALLSCGLLAACQLPNHDSVAPAPTFDPARIRSALPLCTGTLDSLGRTLDAGASEGKTALHQNRVVRAVMHGINRRRAVAMRAIVQEASDDQVAQAVDSHNLVALAGTGGAAAQKATLLAKLDGVIQQDSVGRLTPEDFHQLYDILVRSRMKEIGERIVQYESAYLNGEFVDRFGTKWDAPKPSWQVSDDQISETLTVMLEALADEVFYRTPVWYEPAKAKPAAAADKAKGDGRLFFPGGKPNTPTFIAVIDDDSVAANLQWKMDPMTEGQPVCGMTKLKMDALLFLSNRAGTLAAGQSGLLLGSYGGTSIGLPIVMGKLSVGDNQTLQAMFKAVIAYIAKRGAYEASWHLLLHIDQGKLGKIGDILGNVVLKPGDEAGKPDKPERPKS
jgi:hypothetical protein